MPQINKGTTFVDNQVVTAQLLNSLVDGAQLGSQSITQQTQIANNVVTNDAYIALYDPITTNLRKATFGQVLGSNIPLITSSVAGQSTQTSTTAGTYLATSDITLTPNDSATITGTYTSTDGVTITLSTGTNPHQVTAGQFVSLASAGTYTGTYKVASVPTVYTLTATVPPVYGVGTFVSSTGLNVTVTTTNPHYLTSGQSVVINASLPSYSGTYTVTVTSPTVFTYTVSTQAIATGTTSYTMSFKRSALVPVPTATSCTFVKKGSAKIAGNEIITANTYRTGDSVTDGISTFNNQTIFNGDNTFVGNNVYNGNNQFNGVTNVVGTFTKQGTVIALPIYTFIQTRDQAQYSITWGGNQNPTNLYGTAITQVSLYNYTAKKAGNALILDWNIFCETYDNVVYVVTRTPLSGTGSGTPVALPNSVDSANNTWSGVSVHTYDNNNYDTPQNNLIRIIDTNTLSVPCNYELRVRSSVNTSVNYNFNRTFNGSTPFAQYQEIGMSSLIATELLT